MPAMMVLVLSMHTILSLIMCQVRATGMATSILQPELTMLQFNGASWDREYRDGQVQCLLPIREQKISVFIIIYLPAMEPAWEKEILWFTMQPTTNPTSFLT